MIQDILNSFSRLSITEIVVLSVFAGVIVMRLGYLVLFTAKIFLKKKTKDESLEGKALSMILAVRNEAKQLQERLPKLFSLNNKEFEVVVVDDFSQDSTYLVLGALKEKYQNLKISALHQETRNSVKLAQNIAIKATANDWILNFPVSISSFSEDWISTILANTSKKADVVYSYSNIEYSKGMYNHLYRLECFFQQIRSAGFILNNLPFIYSEENVAFRKEKYFEVEGYGKKVIEPYANLELLINTFIRKGKTRVLFNDKCAVRKEVEVKKNDYFDLIYKSFRIEQHLSPVKQFFLYADAFLKLLSLPLLILALFMVTTFWPFISFLFLLWIGTYLFIIKTVTKHLKERKIFISSLVYDLVMPYFKLFYRWHFNQKTKKNRWRSKV